MTQLHGAYGILPTPFTPDGAADLAQVETMAGRLCHTELTGIVVCGSTSEAVMLTPEENKEIMTAAARALQKDGTGKQLVCGATAADARTSLDYMDHAQGLGAAAVLVAPPYYFPYPAEEVLQFYRDLSAGSLGMAIVAYHIPAFTSPIPLSALPELMTLPRLAGLKNSSANIKEIMHQLQMRDAAAKPFAILSGTDDALLPSLAAGCDGSFTALGAILPRHICALHAAVRSGDLRRAREIQTMLLPLLRLADRFTFPIGYKLLAEAAGLMTTSYRQSIPEAMREAMDRTKEQMAELLQTIAS